MSDEYRKSNREKKLTPKGGIHWCDKCDRNLVSNWSKCGVCGYKNGVKTLKKDT